MDFQKGVPLYDDDYHNQGDEYFSDNYHSSKNPNASFLATAVSDSATFEGL
jgi:hypothetical protein